MFRRNPSSLPADRIFPQSLEKLGYTLTKSGHIRKIDNPNETFEYYLTNSERVNETHREAFHECLRRLVYSQSLSHDIKRLYFPQLSIKKPTEPAIPVLITSPDVLCQCQNVIIVVNDSMQDLGIWSYRMLEREAGLIGGSVIGLIDNLKQHDQNAASQPGLSDPPALSEHPDASGKSQTTTSHDSQKAASRDYGIVVLNPGQLWYSHELKRALSSVSWSAQPRASVVHPPVIFDPSENTVPGHADIYEHIESVFKSVICDRNFIAADARLFIIGIEGGGNAIASFLDKNWNNYKHRVAAIALAEPQFVVDQDITDPEFAQFLAKRARAWLVDELPCDTVLAVPNTPQLHAVDPRSVDMPTIILPPSVSGVVERDFAAANPPGPAMRPKLADNAHRTNPNLRLYLDTLKEAGVGECALETSKSERDVFISEEEAAAKTLEAIHHREHNLLHKENKIKSISTDEPAQAPQQHANETETNQNERPTQDGGDAATESNPEPLETTEYNVQPVPCPTFSSGEPHYRECIFPTVYTRVLDFFREVAKDPDNYENPVFDVFVPPPSDEEGPAEVTEAQKLEMNQKVHVWDISKQMENLVTHERAKKAFDKADQVTNPGHHRPESAATAPKIVEIDDSQSANIANPSNGENAAQPAGDGSITAEPAAHAAGLARLAVSKSLLERAGL